MSRLTLVLLITALAVGVFLVRTLFLGGARADPSPALPASPGGDRTAAGDEAASPLAGLRDDPAGRAVTEPAPSRSEVETEPAGAVAPTGAAGGTREAEDWTLVVQVRDARDVPVAGIPVALQRRWAVRGEVRTESEGRVTEGREGLARFADMGARMEREPGRFSVGLDLLVTGVPEHEVDPAAPPTEPIVLRLPASGSVEVTVLGQDGEPMPDGTAVELGIVAAGEPRELSAFSRADRRYVQAETSAGKALFERVALGEVLEAKASHGQGALESKAYGPGPVRPEERASLVLRLGLEHPVLLFHAVDEEHAPLAGSELELLVAQRAARIRTRWDQTVTTDESGRFRIDVTLTDKGDSLFLDAATPVEGALRVARAEVEGPLAPGEHDLGALVFSAPPVVAAGRVVDEAGAPIEGATVSVESRFVDEEGDVTWGGLAEGEVEADAGGRFEVRGPAGGDALRLYATHGERRSDFVQAEIGERGIRLVAPVSGALSGRVLAAPGVAAERLEIRLAREDKTPAERRGAHGVYDAQRTPDEDGAFTLSRLRPGSYALSVRANETEVLFTVEGLVVSAGETLHDPRVAAIDLRGGLFQHELFLSAPDGDEALSGSMRFHAAGEEDAQSSLEFVSGNPVVLLSGHPAVDVSLAIRGYRGVALEDVRGRREVELERGYPVRLVLTTAAALPDPPTYVKAVLADEDGSFGSIDWGAANFDESREIRTEAFASGRLKVQWIVERKSGGGAMATTVDVEPVQFVEVLDGPGEQVFEVEISAAELERIVSEP